MAEVTIIPAKNRSEMIVRTAAYARVSSDSEDQLNSFNAQIQYYTQMLQNSVDAVFVDMYADEGVTGTSLLKRPEFQRLMNDCRKGKIDRILTKSVSRFARNIRECLEAIRELKTLGISIYFEKENIDTGDISSELMLAMYSQFAQEESMSISRNCRMGIQKRMADGSYKNCSVPYGFIYNKGEISIDAEKSKIVKDIFKWYADGIGTEEIAVRLSKSGIAPPRGKCWRHSTISDILANEKYAGDSLFQKSFTTDTLPFKQIVNRGEKTQFFISNTHQPIIERCLFNQVQKLINQKRKSSDLTFNKSVFSRKIKCICGGTFRRKKCRDKIYWVCRNHDHNTAVECNIRQIRETVFQEAFVKLWNKLQSNYKTILTITLKQLEVLAEKDRILNTQLASIRKEISELKQQIHLLTTLNSQGTLEAAYYAKRSQDLDRRLLTAQKELHASMEDSESERLDELRKLIEILEKSEPITEFDEIKFGQAVKKITVLSESEIRFELMGGIGFTEQIER